MPPLSHRALALLLITGMMMSTVMLTRVITPAFAQTRPDAQPAAEAPPAAKTAPKDPVSTDCAAIRAKMTDLSSSSDDEPITVYLGESFESNGTNLNCSRILECLRGDPRFREGGTFSKPNSSSKKTPNQVKDAIIYQAMKQHYPACVVSGKDGLSLLNDYATRVYRWIAGIVGAICILVIILSGIQITMGGLASDEVGEAKERIYRALTGMVILFISAFILYTINPTFFT